jgi:tetratricopeptide (TPR) repeat protein
MAEWRSAVAGHNAGIKDQAVADIGIWPSYRLNFVIGQVIRLSKSLAKTRLKNQEREVQDLLGLTNEEASQGNANRILKRGALLLTDIAALNPEHPIEFPSRGSQVLVGDGRMVGQRDVSFYWALARQLLDAIQPSPSGDGMVRQWYVATAADMQYTRQWADAITHLDHALKIFPTDALFSFYLGTVHEFLAGPIIQNAVVMTPNANLEVGAKERELKQAQFWCQLAVDRAPEFAEAHLRLGRITGSLGNHTKAIAELQKAAATLTDRPLHYYAALFLGREQETVGNYSSARAQYENAAGLYPTAQTPLLALNYLRRWSMDYPRIYGAMEQILKMSDGNFEIEDPWWSYDVSQVLNAEALMAGMRKAIGGLPR